MVLGADLFQDSTYPFSFILVTQYLSKIIKAEYNRLRNATTFDHVTRTITSYVIQNLTKVVLSRSRTDAFCRQFNPREMVKMDKLAILYNKKTSLSRA